MAALFWIPFLVIPFFLFIVLPQRRQMQAVTAMQSRLAVGEEIVTTSGIYGTIRTLGDETIDLEVAPGVEIRIARRAVGRIAADLHPSAPSAPDAAETGES